MTEYEALCLVSMWAHQYSPFKLTVLGARQNANGEWVVVLECSTKIGDLRNNQYGTTEPLKGQ